MAKEYRVIWNDSEEDAIDEKAFKGLVETVARQATEHVTELVGDVMPYNKLNSALDDISTSIVIIGQTCWERAKIAKRAEDE